MDVKVTNPHSLSDQLAESRVSARSDLDISRHVFFGETSYVVRDPVTYEAYNLSPADYEIFTNLHDDYRLSEIFQQLVARRIIDVSEQESFYGFVVELQKRNLLSLPVTDGERLFQQFEQRRRAGSRNLLMKLLFFKVPLGCPDRFLKSTRHLVRGVFSRAFFVFWLIGLFAAMAIIGLHWREFTADISSALALRNLPWLLIIVSVLKLWHELGHGYACRHFGVSVPTAGLLFLVGIPLAFVDATGSWSLPRRLHRQIINLAGVYFEMTFAIVAAFVWVFVDQPFIKSVAHYTLLIASVSTLAFNANPLIKYDGYFVLSDWLGIPNLRSRSAHTVKLLSKRIFFGHAMPPAQSKPRRIILISYGLAAAIYRMILTVGIAVLISTQVWVVGMLLAAYYLATSFGAMVGRIVRFLLWADEIRSQRKLAIAYLLLLVIGVPAAVLFCPLPVPAHARGVVEPHALHVVHLKQGGFLKNLCVGAGQSIQPDAVLGHVENLEEYGEQQLKRSRLHALQVRCRRLRAIDVSEAAKAEHQINQLQSELESKGTVQRVSAIITPIGGVVLPRQNELQPGAYLKPGEELLRIGGDGWTVRAVANANALADIKPFVGQRVDCRFVANPGLPMSGTIEAIAVAGDRTIPLPTLTQLSGGTIPVMADNGKTDQPYFELSIRLDDHPRRPFLRNGLVCDVRFGMTCHTIGQYFYRAILRFTNQINMSQS